MTRRARNGSLLLGLLLLGAAACGSPRSSGEGAGVQEAELGGKPWCPAPADFAIEEARANYLPPIEVSLVEAIDGDTAVVRLTSGLTQRIRFVHINTEEKSGAQATSFGKHTEFYVRWLLEKGSTIHIASRRAPNNPDAPDTDVFGRWLALVWLDGGLLQRHLVREGFSAYYTDYGCAEGSLHDVLLHAEAEANQNNRGIWAPHHRTDYEEVLRGWIGRSSCRPNPFEHELYCVPEEQEHQDPERQDPERQDPERQDSGRQDPERADEPQPAR
jgi:endonuclease YncB( thermonuclease family)